MIAGEALAVLEGQSRSAALLVVGHRGTGASLMVVLPSVTPYDQLLRHRRISGGDHREGEAQ